jgi:hypothetical protein
MSHAAKYLTDASVMNERKALAKAGSGFMTEGQFWSLIQTTLDEAKGACEKQVELLQERLVALPEEEIIAFDKWFGDFHDRSYRYDLLAAASLMTGSVSDDGFDYFRGWLIAQGREIFHKALDNPDNLADFITLKPFDENGFDFDFECEAILYVGLLAFEKKTGREMVERTTKAPGLFREPTGQWWEGDKVRTMLPRLSALRDRFDGEDRQGEK